MVKGGTPVDFGRSWHGKRILGDGKTWCGLVGGCSAGVALGLVCMMIAFPFDSETLWVCCGGMYGKTKG